MDDQTEEITRSEININADYTQNRNDSMMSVTEDMKIFNQDDRRRSIDEDGEGDS